MEPIVEHLVLYAIFKNSGIRRQECMALLTLLEKEDLNSVMTQLDNSMDNNGGILPTQQEIMEIMWPILMSKGDSDIS